MKASAYLLHVTASPRAELSTSTAMGRALTEQITHKFSHLSVVERDIASHAPPMPSPQFAADNLLPLDSRSASAESDAYIEELEAAKALVISTPMHNFGVPAVLKAWIDQILRPQRTFARSSTGKQGLLADRPVFIIVTSGGPVTGPYAQQDFLTPYLEYVLPTIGLTNIQVIRLDSMLRSPEHTALQIEQCKAWIAGQVANLSDVS
ncbi:FMN-dependent NADH-azoreductase [Pseudomonas fluorescens]|jgi:FMN-dependent NADH-azoreductase|uniref:FMN-dependent NADH-azoreductase n=1 Tax=Pseudomonas fluorescens TaxID=294 RepID=UPI001911BB80|nr:NAD(P)H-dependent oxidoreductase [Pseudomonas fluorescens]